MRLKELREKAGLSRAELARRTGINQPNITRYEKGDMEPRAAVRRVLADFFAVDVAYLMGWETVGEIKDPLESLALEYDCNEADVMEAILASAAKEQTVFELEWKLKEAVKKIIYKIQMDEYDDDSAPEFLAQATKILMEYDRLKAAIEGFKMPERVKIQEETGGMTRQQFNEIKDLIKDRQDKKQAEKTEITHFQELNPEEMTDEDKEFLEVLRREQTPEELEKLKEFRLKLDLYREKKKRA